SPWAGKIRKKDSRWSASSLRRLALVANLPAAVPAVRSAARVSLTWARTASAVAGSAATSDARSQSPVAATADASQSVPVVRPTAAPATLLDLTYSGPEVSAPT